MHAYDKKKMQKISIDSGVVASQVSLLEYFNRAVNRQPDFRPECKSRGALRIRIYLKMFQNDTRVILDIFRNVELLCSSTPGGNQVDGLPPD